MTRRILPLDPATYSRHPIHGKGRTWAENNCYVDVWVELLHSWGFDPVAALPFTLTIDFEGDQWTFFKFPPGDLDELFGLDVQELAIWRPLTLHIEEQITAGRPVLIELDSFHLPDTVGTAYHHTHVKSTVAINEIDPAARRLGYFHNQGYYYLEGDDFARALHLDEPTGADRLPPYVEFVKRRDGPRLGGPELLSKSLCILRKRLRGVPASNPFERFKARLAADLAWLTGQSLEVFHQYSFATIRQFGACFELAATYLYWLMDQGVPRLERPADSLAALATGAKALQFHLARALARKKNLDVSAVDVLGTRWAEALDGLKAAFH